MGFEKRAAEAEKALNTITDFIRWVFSELKQSHVYYGHGTDNAYDEAVALVLQSLKLPPVIDGPLWQAALLPAEKKQVISVLKRRVEERVPLSYLTNVAYYAGLEFYVDERVLIPRSPFAEFTQALFQRWVEEDQVFRILDMCTGSGCIGIGAAYAFPQAEVDLVDISADALKVAQRNIASHLLEERVHPVQSDGFSDLGEVKYDVILANPPYVDAEDMASLPEEFRKEPELALASGDDGLDLTRQLLAQARQYLNPHGFIAVEVGNSWAALEEAFPTVPFHWLEFEQGGHGVFLLTAEQLDEYAAELA